MGLDNSSVVISRLLELANCETVVGSGLSKRQINGPKVVYQLYGPKPDSLPTPLKFGVKIVDAESRLFTFFHKAQSGREVLQRIQDSVNEAARLFDVSVFVFCLDDRRYTPPAKMITREKRRQNQEPPYGDDGVSFCINRSTGQAPASQSVNSFCFTLDGPFPDSYARVTATDALRKKAVVFFCDLVANHLQRATDEQMVVYVDGMRMSSSATASEQSILKTIYLSQIDLDCEDFDLERDILKRGDSNRQQSVAAVAAAPATPATTTTTTTTNGGDQLALSRHVGGHSQVSTPANEIGESDGKCFYWLHRLMKERHERKILIDINDTDVFPLGLFNVPRMADSATKEIKASIWIDYSLNREQKRFVDMVTFWRHLKSGLVKKALAMRLPHPIRHCVELVLFVAMMCGNDYCRSLADIGPVTAFDNVELLLQMVGNLPPHEQPILLSDLTGDMVINETLIVRWVYRIYKQMKRVREAVASVRRSRTSTSTPQFDDEMKELLDAVSLQIDTENRTSANSKSGGANRFQMPDYNAIRSAIRRTLGSLYYYWNLHRERFPVLPSFRRDRQNLSLYGYAERVASIGDTKEYGDSNTVATLTDDSDPQLCDEGLPVQPFVVCIRPRKRKSSDGSASEPPMAKRASNGVPPPVAEQRLSISVGDLLETVDKMKEDDASIDWHMRKMNSQESYGSFFNVSSSPIGRQVATSTITSSQSATVSSLDWLYGNGGSSGGGGGCIVSNSTRPTTTSNGNGGTVDLLNGRSRFANPGASLRTETVGGGSVASQQQRQRPPVIETALSGRRQPPPPPLPRTTTTTTTVLQQPRPISGQSTAQPPTIVIS